MPRLFASDRVQASIAGIAAHQHGVITSQQLIACGLTKSGIWDWMRAGRLHRIYRGLYAVGHRGLSIEGGGWPRFWLVGKVRC